jgi:TPR repeat protein
MYFHGRGVRHDAVIAFALFSLAAANFEIAASNRMAVAHALTPEQIARGEALSRQLAREGKFLVVLDAATVRVPSSAGR